MSDGGQNIEHGHQDFASTEPMLQNSLRQQFTGLSKIICSRSITELHVADLKCWLKGRGAKKSVSLLLLIHIFSLQLVQGCPHFFGLLATYKMTSQNDLRTLKMLNIYLFIYIYTEHFIYAIYVGVLAGSQCRSFYEQSESAAPHFPSLE